MWDFSKLRDGSHGTGQRTIIGQYNQPGRGLTPAYARNDPSGVSAFLQAFGWMLGQQWSKPEGTPQQQKSADVFASFNPTPNNPLVQSSPEQAKQYYPTAKVGEDGSPIVGTPTNPLGGTTVAKPAEPETSSTSPLLLGKGSSAERSVPLLGEYEARRKLGM